MRPELYQRYLEIEDRTGWTMFNGMSLRTRVEGAPPALEPDYEDALLEPLEMTL